MKASHWNMIGALAGLGVLLLAWRSRPLQSHGLTFLFDPATSDLTSYGPQQDATTPDRAKIKQLGNNTPTYSGWGGLWPFKTWGVPAVGVQSPSIPSVGTVSGQTPQNTVLITEATAQQSPSVSPDVDASNADDIAAYYAGAVAETDII